MVESGDSEEGLSTQVSIEAAEVEAECRYSLRDQRGGLVCMRKSEAPVWYDPDGCRYGGPYP
jgi:hypothetical protein